MNLVAPRSMHPQKVSGLIIRALTTGWLVLCLVLALSSLGTGQEMVELRCDELTESSGVAVSTRNPQVIWTHNDSGDSARLFAFTRAGEWLAEVKLNGVKAIDWEDMCSFRRDGKNYLAIGDVGDNSHKRKSIAIYVIEEPELKTGGKTVERLTLADFTRIDIRYADGAVNCESLAYDPLHDQFLLATKELLRSRFFTVPAQFESTTSAPVIAQSQQTIGLPMTTGADISSDGKLLVIVTYGPASLLERRADGSWEVRADKLKFLPLPARKQGESVCFTEDNAALLLTSEFAPTPLWTIKLAE